MDWIEFGTDMKAAIKFGKAANKSEADVLLFDEFVDSSTSGYSLSTDGTKFRIPVNNLNTVCSVENTGLNKRITLPYSMPVSTGFSELSYRNTFKNCTIEFGKLRKELWFTRQVMIDVTSMFDTATFMGVDELNIDTSALKVNSMFYNVKGLRKLTFEECDLTDLRRLMVGSDIKELEFKKCKFILDNDQLVNYDGVSALTVFGSKIEKLMLRNCSKDFVERVMNLFEGEWDLYPRLEIEILD
jgi:hypothetical protein